MKRAKEITPTQIPSLQFCKSNISSSTLAYLRRSIFRASLSGCEDSEVYILFCTKDGYVKVRGIIRDETAYQVILDGDYMIPHTSILGVSPVNDYLSNVA